MVCLRGGLFSAGLMMLAAFAALTVQMWFVGYNIVVISARILLQFLANDATFFRFDLFAFSRKHETFSDVSQRAHQQALCDEFDENRCLDQI